MEPGKALKWARLYGYNFLLMGRKDGQDLSTPLSNKSAKVEYIKAIPRNWITEIVYKKDEAGYRVIPEEVEKINLNPGIFGKNTAIQTKGKEGTAQGTAQQSREPMEAPSTIFHQ